MVASHNPKVKKAIEKLVSIVPVNKQVERGGFSLERIDGINAIPSPKPPSINKISCQIILMVFLFSPYPINFLKYILIPELLNYIPEFSY